MLCLVLLLTVQEPWNSPSDVWLQLLTHCRKSPACQAALAEQQQQAAVLSDNSCAEHQWQQQQLAVLDEQQVAAMQDLAL